MKNLVFLIAFTVLIKPVFPVFEYLINYDYIRTELCVNRVKPELKCNGKCHLMKELAAASEKEKPASQDKKSTSFEITDLFFHELIVSCIPAKECTEFQTGNFHYNSNYNYAVTNSIFHPPAVIL